MRFHLDEHISKAIAVGLRQHGVDVTTTVDAGMRGAEDIEHVAFAFEEKRVIVTHDVDFLRIASAGELHAGIIYCPYEKHSVGTLLRLLLLMNEVYETEELIGQIEYL